MRTKALHFRLLGHPEITLDGKPVKGFVSVKAKALLCYLAVTGRPHSRPTLAGLLWGEKPEQAALTSLRRALSNLRRLVGEHLLITRQTVAFDRHAPYRLDVEELERLVPAGRSFSMADQRRAVELYGGDFLSGLYVRGAPGFEEWALLERARYQALALRALHRLVDYHSRRGEYRRAIRYARRLLELEPWREETHRQVMWLLAHSGQREAALAQYEHCRRVLAADLGVEPMAETTALYERIRASRRTLPPPLPSQPTPFVGRKGALQGVIRRLANPACRLLTLWGPGGVGKTRLALEAAARLREAFLHGVWFIPLASVNPPGMAHLPYAIAAGLNISLRGADEPSRLLFDHLREREMLLVLDNFEHLMDGVSFLSALLDAAPEVKLLVTSRERLRLRWEWLFEVRGLPVPLADERRPQRFDGVRLFIQEARRVRPDFDPKREMAASVRICRLVEGLPLGIELAAALLGEHSAEEVAAGIERTLRFLHSPLQDAPRRQRSLQAAFDHSWGLLNGEERRAFRRLAVFRGGFEARAAEQVAAVTPTLLAALETKSLLRRSPAGRYEILEVLRQYAEEHLTADEDEAEQMRARHAGYYAALLRRLERDKRSGGGGEAAMRFIGRELGNIQAAWRWAVEQEDYRILDALLLPLADFYKRRGWFRDGEQMLAEAVSIARRAVERGEKGAVAALGHGLARLGLMVQSLGRLDEAHALLEEGLTLAERTDERWERAFILNNLAVLTSLKGDYRGAVELFERSRALFAAVGDRRMEAVLLNNIGITYRIMGRYEEAQHFTGASLRICREMGLDVEMVRAVHSLALIAHSRGEYEEAVRRYRETLALLEHGGDRWDRALTLGNLGAVLVEKGDYGTARAVLEESLTLRREMGDRLGVIIALNTLGKVARLLGKPEEALRYLNEALRLAEEVPSVPLALDALAEVAMLRAEQGERERSMELACFVAHHPATETMTRQALQAFITHLKAFPSAMKQGEGPHDQHDVWEVSKAVRHTSSHHSEGSSQHRWRGAL